MNRKRKETLQFARDRILSAQAQIAQVLAEEESARDATPESLQESERYLASCEACEALEECLEQINEALDTLETAITA